MRILNVPVSIIDMDGAVATVMCWAKDDTPNYVCVRDVHGLMQAQSDKELLSIHEEAGLVTPDGMPLVWIGRLRHEDSISRVCGSDLVEATCRASVGSGIRHYFYGGNVGVAEDLASILRKRYPGLEIAGTFTPPFEPVSSAEDERIVQTISASAPHIVWVGLSTPKQEYWMRDHVGRIPGATLIGVGAAFDFLTDRIRRAPIWMQSAGLEWLHRLCSEPRRLWRRYLILAPKFLARAFMEQVRLG
jgi:N-acetylglucosaminyldiphosphoundecaprenol N-acetyl-beta-D-mannosaminyltransferase